MKKIITRFALILILPLNLLAFDFSSTPKELSTYYIAPSQNINLLIKRLEKNQFTILAITDILEGYTILTLTNQELQNTNSYMATLQLNVNEKEIRVQNPSYFGAAYLNDYYYGKFAKTTNALERALGGSLQKSFEKTDFTTLSNYSFMYGLPRKNDILLIKRASNLIEKISHPNKEESIAYKLYLPNGSILVGHKLRKKTTKFLQVLGEEKNAQILPYESMIIGDEAHIMNPKYYLALSLPMLSLYEFMQIASVPDQIYRNIRKSYR